MRKLILITLLLGTLATFAAHAEDQNPSKTTTSKTSGDSTMTEPKRVTGIGGVFFKCEDPAIMKEWYAKNLGLKTDEYGTLFESRNTDNPEQKTYLQWAPFKATTKYFEPSEKQYMINYRVENLPWLLEELRKAGVTIVGEIQEFEYGKFAHIMDPEGNKIELWEPVDNEFTKSHEGKTTH